MLGQGADAQLDGAQFVEVPDQFIRSDGDESGRKTALGYERLSGAFRDPAHGASDLHVLGQIEIMYTGAAGGFGDCDIAVVGQARDDGVDGMLLQLRVERRGVGSVDGMSMEVGKAMRVDHGVCSVAAHIAPDAPRTTPDSASKPEMSAPILPAPRMRTLGMPDLQKEGGHLRPSPGNCKFLIPAVCNLD